MKNLKALISEAIDENPHSMKQYFHAEISEKIRDIIENKKVEVAESFLVDPEDEDFDDEDFDDDEDLDESKKEKEEDEEDEDEDDDTMNETAYEELENDELDESLGSIKKFDKMYNAPWRNNKSAARDIKAKIKDFSDEDLESIAKNKKKLGGAAELQRRLAKRQLSKK